MKKLTTVVSLLVALLLATGIGKIVRATPIEHNLDAADVPRSMFTPLGTIELAGAAGLVIGLRWRRLGIVTSACLLPYFAGAVIAHVRAGDRNVAPAGGGFLLAVATLNMFRSYRRQPIRDRGQRDERIWT